FFKLNKSLLYLRISFSLYFLPFTCLYWFLSLVCSNILFPTSDSEKSFICLFTVSKPSIITLSSLRSFVAKASSTSIQRKFSFNAVCCIGRRLSLISLASLYKCSNFSTSSSVNGSSYKFLIDVLYVKSPILAITLLFHG